MDIAQLEAFQMIAETESLTRAAEALHISQPAMSTMLKRLETDLGAELFDRGPNRIRLNGAGELALRRVNAILRDVGALREDLRLYAQENRTISAVFCDPGVQWWTTPRFSFAHPEVDLSGRLQEEGVQKLLLDQSCDLAVTPRELKHPKLETIPFLNDSVYLSVSKDHPLARRDTVSLRELPAQPLLLPTIGGYFIGEIERIIAEERLSLTPVKNEYLMTQHMIRTTNFLATVSTLSRELRNDGPDRVLVPLSDPELNVTYHITFLKSRREKIKIFLSWAKQIANPQR